MKKKVLIISIIAAAAILMVLLFGFISGKIMLNLADKAKNESRISTTKLNEKEINDKSLDMKNIYIKDMKCSYEKQKWDETEDDDYDMLLVSNSGYAISNIVTEYTMGLSEQEYAQASDNNVKVDLGVDAIQAEEKYFNNNKARVTRYVQHSENGDVETHQVTFLNNGESYIFTIMGYSITDEEMNSFNNMLETVTFE